MTIKNKLPSVVANTLSALVSNAVHNATTLRTELLQKLFDDRRDIDEEAGYTKTLTIDQLRYLYDREGLGTKVVRFWPEESWSVTPEITENDQSSETEFEREWQLSNKQFNHWHYLQRADVLSGIGRYGVILLGINDGRKLSEPILGVDNRTGEFEDGLDYELMYLRVFDEKSITIHLREEDPTSPRFQKPKLYSVIFEDQSLNLGGVKTTLRTEQHEQIHWSRIVHVADNRETSEVFGTPRMQLVYNRLYDARKVYGGSAEMFYKGGWPGLALEANPDIGDVTINETTLRAQLADYFNGLQRSLALVGVSVKSLAPQIADPKPHIEIIVEAVAMAMNVPKRKFMGSEQAQLASQQDERTWNRRVRARQEMYVSPMLIKPYIDRLISVGVLPQPVQYNIEWPDLNTISNQEKADVARQRTRAIGDYIKQEVWRLIPPREYLLNIHGLSVEETDIIIKAAEDLYGKIELQPAVARNPNATGINPTGGNQL